MVGGRDLPDTPRRTCRDAWEGAGAGRKRAGPRTGTLRHRHSLSACHGGVFSATNPLPSRPAVSLAIAASTPSRKRRSHNSRVSPDPHISQPLHASEQQLPHVGRPQISPEAGGALSLSTRISLPRYGQRRRVGGAVPVGQAAERRRVARRVRLLRGLVQEAALRSPQLREREVRRSARRWRR